jgi:hypothetical protein
LDFLESRSHHYPLGSRLQDGAVVEEEVLSLRGRFGTITDTLRVKETRISDGGRKVRYLLCPHRHRVAEERAIRGRSSPASNRSSRAPIWRTPTPGRPARFRSTRHALHGAERPLGPLHVPVTEVEILEGRGTA